MRTQPERCLTAIENLEMFDQTQCVSEDMLIIDDEAYDDLKKAQLDEHLKQVYDGNALVWSCSICNKKWEGNTRDSRRHSRRHMETHLIVKFKCLNCGKILKTKESFYHHKASSCQGAGYQILSLSTSGAMNKDTKK